jgi:acetyl-CoA acetyltransferase
VLPSIGPSDVGRAAAGVDPRVMGIGPVPAVRKLLERVGVGQGQAALFERV